MMPIKYSLREFWELTLQDLHVTANADTEGMWDSLVSAYSQPHRHYHTLTHIEDVLEYVELLFCEYGFYIAQPSNPVPRGMVRLAAFFHDFEYDPEDGPGSIKNSIDSVGQSACLMGLSQEIHASVRGLVRITETHEVNPSLKIEPIYQEILLDSDMAVLGYSHSNYLDYAENVRKEYCPPYSNEQFRLGRIKFLESTLSGRVFRLDMMYDRLETSAMRNMIAELKMLSDPNWSYLPHAS